MPRAVSPPGGRVLVGVALALLLAGCSGEANGAPNCGWDLTTQAGRQANADRLTFATQWIASHPGEPVPAPTSSYWRGDCPSATQVPSPPVEEGDQPDD
jgi:hypothetical protein